MRAVTMSTSWRMRSPREKAPGTTVDRKLTVRARARTTGTTGRAAGGGPGGGTAPSGRRGRDRRAQAVGHTGPALAAPAATAVQADIAPAPIVGGGRRRRRLGVGPCRQVGRR